MPWTNADGLTVFFPGDTDLRIVDGGEYPGAGPNRTVEVVVDLTQVTTSAQAFGDPFIIIPRNSVIESVEVIAEEAAAGGTSLDIGLMRFNGTELDYDGLVNDILLASLNVTGEKNVYTAGVAGAGALVGTETLYPSYLTVIETGNFTDGTIVIRVNLYVKDVDQTPSNF